MITEHVDILGVKISAVDIESACNHFDYWIKNRIKTYVCVVPVSTIVECQENTAYLNVVNRAGMATPDGMPVVWLGKLKGKKNIKRTYGPDLMLAVCGKGQEYRHYFYGGTEETSQQLERKLKGRFSHLNIVGRLSPPFGDISKFEMERMVENINRSNPDILWVGLGSPKQDFWMHEHRDKLHVPVIVGVGAAFDFLAGTKRQAPRWMQHIGLEWFFRLCCEPHRLWKRYLIGNIKFCYYLLNDTIRNRKKT